MYESGVKRPQYPSHQIAVQAVSSVTDGLERFDDCDQKCASRQGDMMFKFKS